MSSQDHHALLEEYNDDMRERQNLMLENERLRMENDQLLQRIKALEAALEPFAARGRALNAASPGLPDVQVLELGLSVGSFRRAAKARDVSEPNGTLTSDEAWALREASDKGFFSPGTRSGADLASSLARRGLLRESARDQIWYITEAGREAYRHKFKPSR